MKSHGDSIKHAQKNQNEDLHFSAETHHGRLFTILDFARHSQTNAALKFPGEIQQLITSLDALPGLTDELFLGYVGKDINNYVYGQGQKFSGGRLSCVAAICLLNKNRLTYLSYGDARINIYTGTKLILLNGAKFITQTVIENSNENPDSTTEDPESFGRRYIDSPLTERVRSTSVKDTDIILMFSDGLEETMSPQRRLNELRRLGSTDPKAIYEALMQATNSAQDDRTLIVITGPYEKYVDPVINDLSESIEKLAKHVDTVSQWQSGVVDKWQPVLNDLVRDVEDLRKGGDALQSSVEVLEQTLSAKVDNAALEPIASGLEDLKSKLRDQPSNDKRSKSAGHAREGAARDEGDHLTVTGFGPFFDQWIDTNQEAWQRLVTSAQKAATEPATTDTGQAAQADGAGDRHQDRKSVVVTPENIPPTLQSNDQSRPDLFWVILLIAVGIIIGWLGTWSIQRTPSSEGQWLLKAEPNRFVLIHRSKGQPDASLPIELSRPLPQSIPPEQRFSSFKDAQEHIVTILAASPKNVEQNRAAAEESPTVENVTDVEAKSGDSLGVLARRYNTTQDKLRELNRNIDWNKLRPGTKIKVPYASGNPQ